MVFVEGLLGMNRSFFSTWGYILVFVILFVESIPFLGAFIPGGLILLLLVGLVSRFEFFVLWKVILVAISASVLIDTLGYFAGRYKKREFLDKYAKFLLIRKETLDRVGRIIHGHTGKALIFGRLNPVTRSVAPFVVGTEKIGFWKFFLWNVIGGTLWVTLFIFAGYLFGSSIKVIRTAEFYIVIGTVLIAGGFYFYYFFNLLKQGTKKIKYVFKKNESNNKE